MSKISVVVPIYNIEKYLNRCVDSILNQTFTDFELILVDDGSPDNCGKICDEYAEKDNRVRVIHKPNGGLSDARNAGIEWALKNSDSEWITFIDSDDWVHPQYLKTLLEATVICNTNLSVCSFVRTKGEEIDIELSEYRPITFSPEDYFIYDVVNATVATGKLYRKDDFRELRYPFAKINEDEYITYKLLFKYKKIAVVPAEMYFYYFNEQSIMHSGWTIKRCEVFNAFKEQIDYFEKNCSKKLYKFRIESLVSFISSAILKTDDKKCKKKMMMFLRYLLRLGRKTKLVIFKNSRPNYELAYPRFMQIYWILKAQFDKIKKNK